MTITALPTIPLETQSRTAFNANVAAFLAALPTFITEMNAESAIVSAAAASLNAEKWVSGTTYTDGYVVWSPTSYLSYRRKGAGGGTTDPASDATNTNWAPTQSTSSLSLSGTTTVDVLLGTSTTEATSTTAAGTKFASGVGIAKALYVGGVTNLLSGVTISGGTSASNVWYGATHGLQFKATTGSTSDLSIWNPAVTVQLLRNPTGTNNLVTGGAFTAGSTLSTGLYTVATLPAGVQGARAFVTDASGPTYGATVVGGGAVVIPVFYDGSAWKCM